MRAFVPVSVAIALGLGVWGCSGNGYASGNGGSPIMVVWHNVDTITHHVVLNDRSVDTGDLAPGASSQPMAIATGGGQYHCSIHPVIIGSVTQHTSTPPDPCPNGYCD